MVTYDFEFHSRQSGITFAQIPSTHSHHTLLVMTANTDKIESIYECQCSSALSSDREAIWTKDMDKGFTGVFDIHEIDEDSETEGETAAPVQPVPSGTDKEKDIIVQDASGNAESEDESAYTDESFCSDVSCDESEIANVTPGSLASDSSSSPLRTVHLQRHGGVKPADAEALTALNSPGLHRRNEEIDSVSDEPPRAVTTGRSVKPRRCGRWNMSFTDEEMRKIERENQLLLRKIMAQQKPQHKVSEERIVQTRISSSAINRRKLQKKIDDDNMLLVRRIQQAKSCILTNASKMSSRLNFL
ncbi:uncharacterized protein LOC105187582 [Harpegnathos saltator]|uniref:uncharacterized protein LOC105187582 n=1 Tax=Harpegnathos saltator TaxID=610380 RepID=UPI00058D3F88|nr:uncharacterized protein LOC105187582 [Harpegnathos saltator]